MYSAKLNLVIGPLYRIRCGIYCSEAVNHMVKVVCMPGFNICLGVVFDVLLNVLWRAWRLYAFGVKQIRLPQSMNLIVTAVFLRNNACPLSPPGDRQDSFCRSSDLRFGKRIPLANQALPSRFPSDRLSSTSLIIGAYSDGSVRDSHPVPLFTPAGREGAAGSQKDVFGFKSLCISSERCLPA